MITSRNGRYPSSKDVGVSSRPATHAALYSAGPIRPSPSVSVTVTWTGGPTTPHTTRRAVAGPGNPARDRTHRPAGARARFEEAFDRAAGDELGHVDRDADLGQSGVA